MNDPKTERLRSILERLSNDKIIAGESTGVEPIELHRLGGYSRWLIDDVLVAAETAGQGDDVLWTDLGSARPADHPELHPEPGTLAVNVGRLLAHLHASRLQPIELRWTSGISPSNRRALDYRPPALIELLESRLEAGLLPSAELPDPYCRYQAVELLKLASRGLERGDGSENVALHGWPSASNMAFDLRPQPGLRVQSKTERERTDSSIPEPRLSLAVSTMWAGTGDRHFDLAIAQRSVQRYMGAEAVFAFYEGYGRDIDIVLLDTYIMVAMLLRRTDDD